jgi:hypothetical protein
MFIFQAQDQKKFGKAVYNDIQPTFGSATTSLLALPVDKRVEAFSGVNNGAEKLAADTIKTGTSNKNFVEEHGRIKKNFDEIKLFIGNDKLSEEQKNRIWKACCCFLFE